MIRFVLLMILASLPLMAQEEKNSKEKEFVMPKKPVVIIVTTQGPIEVELLPKVAPKAVENFLRLAEKGYYNDLTFHRIIKDFMIQGGDPKGDGTGGASIWEEPFEDEVQVDVNFNEPGVLAMANAGPHTNGSQFFITTAPTPWLNMRHTIFGRVTDGMETVYKIEETETDINNRPLIPQKIKRITLKNSQVKEKN